MPHSTLLLSNLYPTRKMPTNGTFITERILAHRLLGNYIQPLALSPTYGPAVRLIRKYANRDDSLAKTNTVFHRPDIRMRTADYLMTKFDYLPIGMIRRFAKATLDSVRSDIQVVHAHGMYMYPAGRVAQEVAAALDVPYVVTMHGSDVYACLPKHPSVFKSVLNSAAAIITVSTALQYRLEAAGIDNANAHVVPNGIDLSLFDNSTQRTTRAADAKLVLFVGHLEEVKGADRLPAIFRQISERCPDATFEVAGAGSLHGVVAKGIDDLPARMLGQLSRTEVADAMARAALLVLPSRSEGWPTVIFEAHASGAAVLGTDVGGMAEAIGDPRFVVADGGNLIERFSQTAASLLNAMPCIETLRDRALNHSWASIANQETEIYRTAITQHQRRRSH